MTSHAVYDVYTDLNPEQLSELAAETFFVWLRFALGQQELGGKRLLHPSGRYASAIHWKRTGVAKVAVIADEDVAPEIGAIEYGHPAISMKDHMLFGQSVRTSKDGYQYRIIPMRPGQGRPTPTLQSGSIQSGFNGGRVRSGLAKMWAKPRPWVDKNSNFRTMSNRPGSAPWIIPMFHPYAPAKFLADLLQGEFGK